MSSSLGTVTLTAALDHPLFSHCPVIAIRLPDRRAPVARLAPRMPLKGRFTAEERKRRHADAQARYRQRQQAQTGQASVDAIVILLHSRSVRSQLSKHGLLPGRYSRMNNGSFPCPPIDRPDSGGSNVI